MSLVFSYFILFAVAPICYAHLAAAQMSQFIKFDEMSETASSQGGSGGVTVAGAVPVQELPRLHKNVVNSMFFCWSSIRTGFISHGDAGLGILGGISNIPIDFNGSHGFDCWIFLRNSKTHILASANSNFMLFEERVLTALHP